MPHKSRTEFLSPGAENAASAIVELGGAFEHHPAPQVLLEAACGLTRDVLQWMKSFATVPAIAQGSFLQPPAGSHFGREMQ